MTFHFSSGDCEAGFYCEGGANTSAPSPSAAYPLNDVCPPGYYCPNGTKMWVQCPIGTYRATTSKKQKYDCDLSLFFFSQKFERKPTC